MEQCLACGHGLPAGGHAVRVDGWLERPITVDFLVCSDCWTASVTPGGVVGVDAVVNQQLNKVRWGSRNRALSLYGGSVSTGILPCAGCGIPVERGVNPRMRSHTCSRRCTARVSKGANTVARSVTDCEVCEVPLTGRADRRFCSDRCRQRAHRGGRA